MGRRYDRAMSASARLYGQIAARIKKALSQDYVRAGVLLRYGTSLGAAGGSVRLLEATVFQRQ